MVKTQFVNANKILKNELIKARKHRKVTNSAATNLSNKEININNIIKELYDNKQDKFNQYDTRTIFTWLKYVDNEREQLLMFYLKEIIHEYELSNPELALSLNSILHAHQVLYKEVDIHEKIYKKHDDDAVFNNVNHLINRSKSLGGQYNINNELDHMIQII